MRYYYLTGSSALRLCVWLSDDGYFQITYINQCFLLAFRAIKRIVLQNRIFP